MLSNYKKLFFITIATLSVVGYGVFVFAAAPLGGYTPGQILDPDCAPLETDCVVTLPVAWGLSGNAGTIAGTNFIGTTDAVDVVIKANGNEMARFYNSAGTKANSIALAGATANATNMFAVGNGAGASTTNSAGTIFIGYQSGQSVSNVVDSIFLGTQSGKGATESNASNFIGSEAGLGATNAYGSNFFGYQAGKNAVSSNNSNFLGNNAGSNSSFAGVSNFFGPYAGADTHAAFSNFFGYYAGERAIGAVNSNFFGYHTGTDAANAANSIFIGYEAGFNDTVDNSNSINDSSILIGNFTSTGGFSNSIALGANAVNTATNQLMIGSVVRPINEVVIKGSGTCSIVSTGISCSSDERLKTNIEDLSINTLANVVNVRTVLYNWNSNPTGEKVVGFLAQDLERYFPRLVRTDSDGFKMVNYAQMTPILVEAIREMNLNITMIADMSRPNTWRNSFIAWFGNVENGITDIYANVFHANRGEFKDVQTDRICVGQTCVTETQLQQMMQQNNIQTIITPPTDTSTGTDPADDEPTPVSTDTSTDTPIISDPIVPTENTEPTPVAPDVSTEQPSV